MSFTYGRNNKGPKGRSIWYSTADVSNSGVLIFDIELKSSIRDVQSQLLAGSMCHVWSLSDSKGIQTHKYLVCKWTLNHLAKLAK